MTSNSDYVEFLDASEPASERGIVGWVSREGVSEAEAIEVARRDAQSLEACVPLKIEPVLMRLQSEVEARINGGDEDGNPLWVECTKRARRPVPYWRVEVAS